MPVFKQELHRNIYVFGLILLAASLTLSLFMMSVAQFILLFNWILEGNFRQKISSLKRNKAVWAALSLFLIHILGLFYTNDFSFALDDLRIKLPLLALPVIFSTSAPLSKPELRKILLFHVAASLVASFIGIGIYIFSNISDMRDISVFISHIRFSLNICVDIFILIYFIFFDKNFSFTRKFIFSIIVLWFLYFLYFTESFTGIIILLISTSIILLVYIFTRIRRAYKLLILFFLALFFGTVFLYLRWVYIDYSSNKEKPDFSNLEEYTPEGGIYYHDVNNKMTDNGYYTWLYVCDQELEAAWNKRSNFKYDSLDKKGQPVRYTIIRFLTSKGDKKNGASVRKLTDQEVKYIENGIANINDIQASGFINRLKNTIWEYENYRITGDPRGSSWIQRIELWKTSRQIIEKYFFIGVGTGDPYNVFTATMVVNDSPLKDSGLRSHNQFLTMMIAFGITGLIVLLFSMIYPAVVLKKFSNFIFLPVFIISSLSMLTEDTLESQAGVTFYAFFIYLLLFSVKKDSENT